MGKYEDGDSTSLQNAVQSRHRSLKIGGVHEDVVRDRKVKAFVIKGV